MKLYNNILVLNVRNIVHRNQLINVLNPTPVYFHVLDVMEGSAI